LFQTQSIAKYGEITVNQKQLKEQKKALELLSAHYGATASLAEIATKIQAESAPILEITAKPNDLGLEIDFSNIKGGNMKQSRNITAQWNGGSETRPVKLGAGQSDSWLLTNAYGKVELIYRGKPIETFDAGEKPTFSIHSTEWLNILGGKLKVVIACSERMRKQAKFDLGLGIREWPNEAVKASESFLMAKNGRLPMEISGVKSGQALTLKVDDVLVTVFNAPKHEPITLKSAAATSVGASHQAASSPNPEPDQPASVPEPASGAPTPPALDPMGVPSQ
jgi:hypothetical protein